MICAKLFLYFWENLCLTKNLFIMARLKRGILGGISGKVANVIGGSWKGIDYVRSMPLSVANPRTVGQVLQRSKMAVIVFMAQMFQSDLFPKFWNRFATGMSGFNAFVKTNIGRLGGDLVPAFDAFVYSRGKLAPVIIGEAVYHAVSRSLVVSFTTAADSATAADNDEVWLFAVSHKNIDDWGQTVVDMVTRDEESFVVSDVVIGASFDIHVYLCVRRPDGTIVSNSAYIQATIVND